MALRLIQGFEFQMGRGGLGRMPSPGRLDRTASKGTLMLPLCLADLHPEKEQVSTKMVLKVVAGNPTVFKEYVLSLGSRKVWLRGSSKEIMEKPASKIPSLASFGTRKQLKDFVGRSDAVFYTEGWLRGGSVPVWVLTLLY